MEQISTNNIQEIRQRWGSYTDIVEKVWVYENQGTSYWRDFQWVVPGAVISEYYVTCDNGTCLKGERLIQYNMTDRRIERFTDKGALRDIGKIDNNGKVIFVFSGYPYPAGSVQFDPVNKKFITDVWRFSETTREKFATATGFSHAETKMFQTDLSMQDSQQNNKLSIDSPQKVSNNLLVSQPKVVEKKRKNETSLINGTYQAEGGNYCVKVVQENNTLHLIEPNKESLYKKQSDGIYHFYNQKNDTTYGLRIVDDHTLDSFKPFVNGNQSTRLVLISDLSICASTAQVKVSKKQTWKDDDSDFGTMFTAVMLGAQKGFTEAAEQRRIEDETQAQFLHQLNQKNQAIAKQREQKNVSDDQPLKSVKNNTSESQLLKNNIEKQSNNQTNTIISNANKSSQVTKNTSSTQSYSSKQESYQASKKQEQSNNPSAKTLSAKSESNVNSGTLRFILYLDLKMSIDWTNVQCYSKVITLPAPIGWRSDVYGYNDTTTPSGFALANKVIDSYELILKKKCIEAANKMSSLPKVRFHKDFSVSPVYDRNIGRTISIPSADDAPEKRYKELKKNILSVEVDITK